MIQVHDKHFEAFINEDEILAKIVALSQKINSDYANKSPLFLGVLNGSFMFAAELFKNIDLEAEITFIRVQSYQNTTSQGKVTEILGLTESIKNKDIIIIEDIVDTGLTIEEVIKHLSTQSPSSIAIATLLFKPLALKTNLVPDYVCFEIDPKFVIGYGLDYDGLGRNLKGIYVLKE
jgi:hypoxanthine phosphoribosyltransferase